MGFTVPYAGGLARELLSRVEEERLGLSGPYVTADSKRGDEIRRYFISLDDSLLGEVNVKFRYYENVSRIFYLEYRGRIPGYVTMEGGKIIAMVARGIPGRESDLEGVDLSKPNNTPENPLYRVDGHPLEFADYEVDAEGRIVIGHDNKPVEGSSVSEIIGV
jgi:hypothetical protein